MSQFVDEFLLKFPDRMYNINLKNVIEDGGYYGNNY